MKKLVLAIMVFANFVQLNGSNWEDLSVKEAPFELFYKSLQIGDASSVSNYLAKFPDLIDEKVEHQAPLTYAAEKGSLPLVKVLLPKTLDPNVRNRMGQTPLMLAAWEGHVEVVKELLKDKRVRAGDKDGSGYKAEDYAKDENRIEVLKELSPEYQ